MTGRAKGRIKQVCAKYNISFIVWMQNIESGLKWCYKCKSWKTGNAFSNDKSRWDGKRATCGRCDRVKVKKITKGRVSAFKGKKHSEETKKILSIKSSQRTPPMVGRRHSTESKKKMSLTKRITTKTGKESPQWKNGSSERRRIDRRRSEYREWRLAVFERDHFTCRHCGDNKGGNLNAHHIKPYADFIELRFELDNGLTLCKSCHIKIHKKDG